MKLYEIANEYQSLLDSSEFDEETGEILTDPISLSSNLETFKEKAVNVAKYFNSLDAEADAIRQAEKMMKARRESIEARSESLRNYLLKNMQACDISEIKCEYFAIKRKLNRASVDDYAPELIPGKFINVKTVESFDRDAIRRAIESGEDVPGARLVRKEKLEIK